MAYYTLIAHKPDSADYCRGCPMESYAGDFELSHGGTLDTLRDGWKRLLNANAKLGRGEADYELTLLINGAPLEDIPSEVAWLEEGMDPALVALAADAKAWIARLETEVSAELEGERRLAEQTAAAKKRREAQEQEERDRAQYLALRNRFEGGHHA